MCIPRSNSNYPQLKRVYIQNRRELGMDGDEAERRKETACNLQWFSALSQNTALSFDTTTYLWLLQQFHLEHRETNRNSVCIVVQARQTWCSPVLSAFGIGGTGMDYYLFIP